MKTLLEDNRGDSTLIDTNSSMLDIQNSLDPDATNRIDDLDVEVDGDGVDKLAESVSFPTSSIQFEGVDVSDLDRESDNVRK